MSSRAPSLKAPLFLFVSVLAFGMGMVLVIAAQQTTENRSRASVGPYDCSVLCGPPAGNLASNSCQQCLSAGGTVALTVGSGCSMDAPPESPVSCENCPGDYYINQNGRPTCGTQPIVTSPTPPPGNAWDQCMSWDQQNNCLDTYRTYKQKRDADWRCKKIILDNYPGLCPYSGVEFPTEPMN